jgi:hypothetical protein
MKACATCGDIDYQMWRISDNEMYCQKHKADAGPLAMFYLDVDGAIKAAYLRGWQAAIEAAAQYVEHHWNNRRADAIRALTPPASDGGAGE